MINNVVEYVVSQLNDHIKSLTGEQQDSVVAASLVKPDGQPNQKAEEKVAVAVVNVETDRVYHSVETIVRRADGTNAAVHPEIQINLYLLFAANLAQYVEALKAISRVIAFFQRNPAVEYGSIPVPGNPKRRIVFELFSPTFEQQNHLWGAMGTKYVPSVLYKAGLLGISGDEVLGEVPVVRDLEVGGRRM